MGQRHTAQAASGSSGDPEGKRYPPGGWIRGDRDLGSPVFNIFSFSINHLFVHSQEAQCVMSSVNGKARYLPPGVSPSGRRESTPTLPVSHVEDSCVGQDSVRDGIQCQSRLKGNV